MRRGRSTGEKIAIVVSGMLVLAACSPKSPFNAAASSGNGAIEISSTIPFELNPPFVTGPPPSGGAAAATPDQAARFAWQEFIAMNWPAGPQAGQLGQREAPSTTCHFGDTTAGCRLLVWETLRGKAEIFPGDGSPPPGYAGSTAATSWGYDTLPQYHYAQTVAACDARQASDAVPWVNLDETDQITLDNMYAGVVDTGASPGNSAPQLVRFLAKGNRAQYGYVAGNSDPNNLNAQWWSSVPPQVTADTRLYLKTHKASPPSGSKTMVSLPDGTIEVKAGWRPLTTAEAASGRFHTQTVRFYEGPPASPCYRDAIWGLVSLHIIQKTPSAPFFIYATFEQADNILTADGRRAEDDDGVVVVNPGAAATAPQVCLRDPVPNPAKPAPPGTESMPSVSGSVIRSDDAVVCKASAAPTYCDNPGARLYYRNADFKPPNNEPNGGNICVERRSNDIPDYVIAANRQAHAAIEAYRRSLPAPASPWSHYKLVNVQYFPIDKVPDSTNPNSTIYAAKPPYTASHPAPSSFYQANIVVETNRSLQLFSGGLSPTVATDWNQDGSPHKNTYFGGRFYNMGGCMGCHGSQGQNPKMVAGVGDFSVILARGAVLLPEVPSIPMAKGLSAVFRNRSISK